MSATASNSSSTNNGKVIVDLAHMDNENPSFPIPLKDLPNEMWKEILQYCEPKDLYNCRLVNKTWKNIASKALRAKKKILDLRVEPGQLQNANMIFGNPVDHNDFPVSQISVRITEHGILPFMQSFGRHLEGLRLALSKDYSERFRALPLEPRLNARTTWSIFCQILLYCQNLKQIRLDGMGFSDREMNPTGVPNPNDLFCQRNLKLSKIQNISFRIPMVNDFCLNIFKRFISFVPATTTIALIKETNHCLHLPSSCINQILDEIQKFAPRIKLDYFKEFKICRNIDQNQNALLLIQKLLSLQPVPMVNQKFILRMGNLSTPQHYQIITEFLLTQSNNFTSLKIDLNYWKFRIPVLSTLKSLDLTFPKYDKDKVYLIPFTDEQFPCLTNVELNDYCDAFGLFNGCTYDGVKSLKIKYAIGTKQCESRWDLNFPNLTNFTLEGHTEYLESVFKYMNNLEELVFKLNSKFTTKDINDVLTGFEKVNQIYEEYEEDDKAVGGNRQKLLEDLRVKSRTSKPSLLNLTNLKKLEILYADPYNPITDAGASFSILLMQSLDCLNLEYSELSPTCSTSIEKLHTKVSLVKLIEVDDSGGIEEDEEMYVVNRASNYLQYYRPRP